MAPDKKRIAVLTSGGDAPGMNAAVRAVVRSSLRREWEIVGIRFGFAGLLSRDFCNLETRDVSGTIDKGGTFLRTSRCTEFLKQEAQERAVRFLWEREIEGLVVIGGDGSQAGAHALSRRNFPVVGIPATIDNDVFGTDLAIGVDTALNIALEAIDRIKVTAASHQWVFLVEVLGRDSGYLALVSGIAGGAELVVIPEVETDLETMATQLVEAYARGHAHAIAVVAEGSRYHADVFSNYIATSSKHAGIELRVTKLGHVQRGGAPGVADRLLASQLGVAACDCFAHGEHGVLVGVVGGKVIKTALATVVNSSKRLDSQLTNLYAELAN